MNTIPVPSSQRHQQEEAQPAAPLQRTHPRYAYDTFWQNDIARCESGQLAVLGVHCHCNGELFGARRGDGFAFFAGLEALDPHSFQVPVPTPAVASSLARRHLASGVPRQEIRQEVLL